MVSKKSYELNEEMLNKIISVAYGDATMKDKFIVMRSAKKNPKIREVLLSYTQTAKEVNLINEEECSEDLLKGVVRKNFKTFKHTNSFLFDLYTTIFSRPIISTITVVTLIATIITALIINKPVQYTYKYSQAEIINADKQARQALAIVGNFFKQTQSTLEAEILGKRVAKPINDGIGIVNNILEGETK